MASAGNQIPIVDTWSVEDKDDEVFTNAKDVIVAPVSNYYHVFDEKNYALNYFWIKSKKSYNSDKIREHCCHYLNYFEKYFDPEREYLSNISYIKYLVDLAAKDSISPSGLVEQVRKYIICDSLYRKVINMVNYNYSLELSYKSANNPQLQYNDEHAKALLSASIMMNLCIPIITHFAYVKRIQDIDEFLLDTYDYILYAETIYHNVDINSKLYETSISNVNRNAKNNVIIWQKQDIRGKDTITHSLGAVRNIVLNIMPKYKFSQNMVSLNYTSINIVVA